MGSSERIASIGKARDRSESRVIRLVFLIVDSTTEKQNSSSQTESFNMLRVVDLFEFLPRLKISESFFFLF